jgi:hypothetical protein
MPRIDTILVNRNMMAVNSSHTAAISCFFPITPESVLQGKFRKPNKGGKNEIKFAVSNGYRRSDNYDDDARPGPGAIAEIHSGTGTADALALRHR